MLEYFRGTSDVQSHVSRLHPCRLTVEVTAESLHEAVARGLAAFREADWSGEIGHGPTTITVVVKQPEVQHRVCMRDFRAWLESNGPLTAEMVLKSRLRELLEK
jgi:hypothetical protein